MKTFDLLVIGGGSAGIACSRRAASYGQRVALFEYKRLGGTCVNVGCVPKKVMFNTSEINSILNISKDYGFFFDNKSFDFKALKKRRDAYIERLNAIYLKKLNELNVEVVPYKASFVSNEVVEAEGLQYTAPVIVIAVGGEPSNLDIPGGEYAINSDDFFNKLDSLPKKCAVIGGGYIGVELSGVLCHLGSEVTIICRKERILSGFDEMLQEALMEEMKSSGVHFQMHTNLKKIEKRDDLFDIYFKEDECLKGYDLIIFAVGRHPVSKDLHVEKTDVELDSFGYVKTDEWDETNVKGVFSLGDVNGKILLTPVAIAAGRALSDRIFGNQKNRKMDYEMVPSVVFSHPPIGSVGLSETNAIAKFGEANVKVYTSTFVNMFYAVSKHKPKTKYKIVCTLPDEKVVGLQIIGLSSDEVLQGFAVAIKMGATKKDFDSCVAVHPTAAEELVTMA